MSRSGRSKLERTTEVAESIFQMGCAQMAKSAINCGRLYCDVAVLVVNTLAQGRAWGARQQPFVLVGTAH